MKISILINPVKNNSSAIQQAYAFIQAAMDKKYQVIQVFFYGYAVEFAFSQGINDIKPWQYLSKQGIKLLACSTLAEKYLEQSMSINKGFELAGLGQWNQSILNAEKYLEFS